MEKPNIYVLHSAIVIGIIVNSKVINEEIICQKCELKKLPKQYKEIKYEIDYWNNQDIVQGESIFMVSNRLKYALEESEIKGCSFEKVEILKSSFFEDKNQKEETNLPVFWSLNILERYIGPEIWWRKIPCKDCDKKKWDITNAGIISISVPFNIDPIPTRKVFFDSWKGADIFYLQDPDAPIVTEQFVDILKKFNCEINLLESDWV
ncbi:hypothetical protein [Flavobacterium sp. HNIBRBA15423]|uniref:hypothetical protein n=1 Tax=Flavobacterium sp. HNIBRBA15423 TaxID=3458683 RepID=UPI0040441185